MPLARIERGVGTLPLFVRTVHGAVFADFGEAWNTRFRTGEITRSLGAELSIDAVLGYALPLTFTGGLAWQTLDDRGGPVFFARIGRGF